MRKNIIISDQSGVPISTGTGAVVTIKFNDPKRGTRVLDLTDGEAERLGGRQAKRRNRPEATETPYKHA